MAKKKETELDVEGVVSEGVKTEEVKSETKKYIAKAVLVGEGKTYKVDEIIELTDAQAERLLDLELVEIAEGEE